MSPALLEPDTVSVPGEYSDELEYGNTADPHLTETWSDPPDAVMSFEGGMLRVRQMLMTPGQPYAAVFEGVPVVAIKQTSGEVDFYYIPPK